MAEARPANAQSFAYQPEINPKRVNLALKTILEFHPKDKQSDIKLLDDIKNVITEIRTIIDENGNIKNFRRNFRDETLTGFIQDAINIINTYEDTAFDDFVHILGAEIRKYHYRGCKFSELTANHGIEKLITAKLDSIKSRSTYLKKMKINALSGVLKYEDYDSDVKKIMDYINSLYAQAGDKFRRFLSNLKGYGKSKSSKSNTNLVKIIRNGLRSIIFDHYTNLSLDTRRHLRYRIENFWRRYKSNHPSKGDNVAKVTPYNTKNSKTINEAKDIEPHSRKYQKNTNNKINLESIKTKQSQHKDKITNKYDLKNEEKRHKNTRKETIDESFKIQEEETRQSSQNSDLVVQPWDEIKLQGQTGDVDSLSASFNSIDLHKDQQDNTLQFITIFPHKYTEKSTKVSKKPEIIDTMNLTTNNTIQKKLLWIEQSTGRLPKAVLDKLANKASRSKPDLTGKNLNKYDHKYKKNKNQKRWHRKVNKPDKTRRKGYEPENAETHEKKFDPLMLRSERIRDKTNDKIYQQESEKTLGKIYKNAGGKIEPDNDSLFNNMNEEVQQYNKTKGMLRLELKHENRSIRFTPKPGKTIKHLARVTTTTKKAPAFTRSPRSQLDDIVRTKPTHQTSPQSNSSLRWLHLELPLKTYSKSNNKWSKKHDKYSKKSTEYSTSFKEGVTARNIEIIDDKRHNAQTTPFSYIKDSFERHSNRGISRANDNTEEGRKVKHRFEVKRYVEKDTSKMADTTDYETDSINYVSDKDSKIEYNEVKGITFRSGVNMIPDDFKVKDKLKIIDTDVSKTEFSIEDDYRHNAQTTSFSNLRDVFQGQLNRGINRTNEEETKEEQKKKQQKQRTEEERKVNHRFEVKKYLEKSKQLETMSTTDDTLKQDTSKMADTTDHKMDSINYVSDKHSKIKDNDVERGITLKTRFGSGVNMIPDDLKVKDKLNTAETSANKTEVSIEDDKRHNAQTTSFSYLNELYEGQLNRGINRANEEETKKQDQKLKQQTQRTEEERKVKHRFGVKRYVEKPKQIETMSTTDDTLKQDTSKMAETAGHETDLINYVTDKDSKIKDYDVTHGTAGNKTEFSIEDHKDKYADKNKEGGKKAETGFKSGFEMLPIDNMVRLNVKGAAKNETDFIIEHFVDEDSKNSKNRIEKAEKINTRFRLNENNNVKVTDNKLNMAGTAVNKIDHIKENYYIQDKDSKNNGMPVKRFRSDNTEVTKTADNITEYKDSKINIENGKKSETNLTSDINMMPNDFNDRTEEISTRTADTKVDFIEKENNFISKEDVVDKDHQIYQVVDQTSIIREAPKETDQVEKDTKQQYNDDVTNFEAKYEEINNQDIETLTKYSENKVIMKDQKDQDFLNNDNSFGTQTPTTSIASKSSSMKGTESTMKASATTVKAESYLIVNGTTNKMADTLPHEDVFESIK